MSTIVTEMALFAREEPAGPREVAVAANQMDKTTQQNAAMVDETTSTAQSLLRETEELARLAGQFVVAGAPGLESVARSEEPRKRIANRPAMATRLAAGAHGSARVATAEAKEWAEF